MVEQSIKRKVRVLTIKIVYNNSKKLKQGPGIGNEEERTPCRQLVQKVHFKSVFWAGV